MAQNDETNRDAAWSAKELSAEELEAKNALLSQRVRAVAPSQTRTVADLLRAFAGMSIQARNLGQCYEVLEAMLRDPDRPTILLGLAGPLIAGGLRQVIRELVEHNLVDVVVSTGAILYQDIYQARGYAYYRGSIHADDGALRELYVDRIYDTYVDEIGFAKTDTWIGRVADELAPGAYSSRTFMDALADRLDDPLSIVATCRRHGVPMFLPALNDSSIGIGLTEHHHRGVVSGKPGVVISSIQDNYELTQIVARSPATAAFFVAGDEARIREHALGAGRGIELHRQGGQRKDGAGREDEHAQPCDLGEVQEQADQDQDPAQARADIDGRVLAVRTGAEHAARRPGGRQDVDADPEVRRHRKG